jgi:hypothetical protein
MRLKGPGEENALEIRIDLPKGDLRPPVGANYFQMARFGMEIELLACFVDPQVVGAKAAQAKAKNPNAPLSISLTAEILHRFSMSPQGFETLRASVQRMAETMVKKDEAKA